MTERRSLMADMAVDIPEGTHGSVTIERFEVTRESLENFRLAMEPGNRSCQPGTYTRLLRDGRLWMSDTTAERRDHIGPAIQIDRRGGRVLIGGLGLGMILRVALLTPGVEHVDVVELNGDVIDAVGPHYEKMAADAGKSLTIHHADLYKIRWPVGTRWNVAWFDIWADMSTDVLEQMTPLLRSYGRRADWQDCWGRHTLLYMKRREARSWW